MATSLVMGQADQLGIALTVSRSSQLASPIMLSLEGMIPAEAAGYDEVSASFGIARLEGSAAGTTLHFNTTARSDGGTRALVVRATAEGAPDATAPLALIIGAQTVYEGAMPTNDYLTYGVRPNGDRCDWHVQWTGKVVVTFDSLLPGSSGTHRFIGTRTGTPLVDYVGETNCVGSPLSYDLTTPFVSIFPGIGGSIDIVRSSSIDHMNLGGYFADPLYANTVNATLDFGYERTASDETGGVDMPPQYEILLVRKSNREPAS